MLSTLRGFLKREDGAVTVDWVVLTGAVVLVATGAVVALSNDGISDLIGGVSAQLDTAGDTAPTGLNITSQ